jgi:hypothetical protein
MLLSPSEMENPMAPSVDTRSPLQSKKFCAAMTFNILWLLMIGYGIHLDVSDAVMLSMVITSGSTQMVYLGGQAAVDAYLSKMASGFRNITKAASEPKTPTITMPPPPKESQPQQKLSTDLSEG